MRTRGAGKPETLKVGGQALADGVFMRTDLAWGVARADGTVEVGAVPPNRAGGIPVLRVLAGLVMAMKLGIGKGLLGKRATARPGRRSNRRFLIALIATEASVAVLGWGIDRLHTTGWLNTAVHVIPWIVVLAALRAAAPASVWRYHGAEHKAVSAYERGVDLTDVGAVLGCSRIHDRCGTNLVFLMALAGALLQREATLVQVPLFLLAIAGAVELMSLAARRPASIASRMLVGGGKALQRHVTTAEPSPFEQEIGCRALLAALAEHDRLAHPVEATALLEPAAA